MGRWRRDGHNYRTRRTEEELGLEEIKGYLQKTKKGNAPGPDGIQMEAFQLMDDNNLEVLRGVINSWIERGEWPEDLNEANVQSIYKKGDPKAQENYRPISLLNSIYKIIAGITKIRIDKGGRR